MAAPYDVLDHLKEPQGPHASLARISQATSVRGLRVDYRPESSFRCAQEGGPAAPPVRPADADDSDDSDSVDTVAKKKPGAAYMTVEKKKKEEKKECMQLPGR